MNKNSLNILTKSAKNQKAVTSILNPRNMQNAD